jgi:hypothetical protein
VEKSEPEAIDTGAAAACSAAAASVSALTAGNSRTFAGFLTCFATDFTVTDFVTNFSPLETSKRFVLFLGSLPSPFDQPQDTLSKAETYRKMDKLPH